jgi:hypothetical protein
MDATALLPLLTVFAAVTVVLFLVTGGLRTKTGTEGSGRNGVLGRLSGPNQAPGFPSALVATTAAATALSLTNPEPFTTGALLGILTAAFNIAVLAPIRKILYAVAGGAGTIAALTTNLTPVPGCTPAGLLGTWFTILLAAIAALAAAAGWLTGHTPTPPLAFFSALTVIAFLASPLGVPALNTTNPALTAGTGIIAAAVFGYTAGRWPGPVTGLAALTITLTTIGTAAYIAPACQTILNNNQAPTLIAFGAVYTVIHLCTAPFRRHT